MAWRVHLANTAIRRMEVVAVSHAMLAAWTTPLHVHLFDMADGAPLLERTLPPLPSPGAEPGAWAAYRAHLTLPHNATLGRVSSADRHLFSTDDPRLLLHWDRAGLALLGPAGAEPLAADGVQRWRAVDVDADTGLIAALADDGRLCLFDGAVLRGMFTVGLQPDDDRPCHLSVRRGQAITACDGQTLVTLSPSGAMRKRIALHYQVAHMTASADGQQLLLVDREDAILRLYRAADLLLTHQKFAIDLVAQAAPRQLIEELPPVMTAVSSAALGSGGVVCFAMSGVVCVTDQAAFSALPK